ncbi:class I SAM-dependent DNA methyltransferase, partial [bacterium]|nr:class I SAM-dependent DNA methyltransferase [bacterium]
SPPGERTLQAAIIPPGLGHIDALYSYAFKDIRKLISIAASWSSLVLDFFVKSMGTANFHPNLAVKLPVAGEYEAQTSARTLGLNCVTSFYSDLWKETFQPSFAADSWTSSDPKLPNKYFSNLKGKWKRDSALRTDFARRQALLELDVLVAMGLGMSLDDLITIYRVQFPIMRQYDRDTWYDQNGRIIFTNSKGLTGVGLARKKEKGSPDPGWEDVRDMKTGSVEVVIEDDTMPGGPVKRKITYKAPFERGDREADYAQAWAEFKRRGL